MLPLACCDPAQKNSVCQPLSQLGCRRNMWTRLGSCAPGPLLPEKHTGLSTNRPEAMNAASQSKALIALLITEQSTWREEERGVTSC